MLCREGRVEVQCWIESANATRIVVRRRGSGRPLVIDARSATELIFDASFGKLLLVLRDTTLELMPQSPEELDLISGLVARYLALKGEVFVSKVGEVLRAFCRVVRGVVEVVATLQGEPRGGLDWVKVGEALRSAESALGELLSVAPTALSLPSELSRGLTSAAKDRHVKGLGGSLKAILVGAYEASRGEISKVLPGTYPEVLLDLALLFALNSAVSSGRLRVTEEEAKALAEESGALMGRLSKLLGVERSLLSELEVLLRSGSGELESFAMKLGETLGKHLAGGARTAEEELV